MKTLNNYITEKFQVSKDYKRQYVYTPKDKNELIKCIEEKIDKEGYGTKENPLNLNDIDTSEITDMKLLFDALDGKLKDLSKNGNFDISNWDVSNVENMGFMFGKSNFDGDISDWDVYKVKNMRGMFADSCFNGDISDWDVSNVENMVFMFANCPLENNPPKWYHA